MDIQDTTARKVAAHLLNIKAVRLNVKEPFTWASGIKSPIYCDNRRILSFPQVRNEVRDALCEKVRAHFPDAEIIAGVATGAIAHGVLVAQALNLPFVYVRSAQKQHGLGNQVEGEIKAGQKVAVIEDLVSTGQSSLLAVEALENMGCQVLGMVAIFSYGFEQAARNMELAACTLVTLSNYQELIKEAVSSGAIHHSNLDILERWSQNPNEWGNLLA